MPLKQFRVASSEPPDVLEQLALKASKPGLVLICAGDAKRITREV